MGSVEIFGSATAFSSTITALLTLVIATLFMDTRNKIGKGIWFLVMGLGVELLVVWIDSKFGDFQKAGIPINLLVFIELSILLISTIFFTLAASKIINLNIPELTVVLSVFVIGMISIISFIFIFPDGDMIVNMRSVFPLIGLAYVSVSFWSKIVQKNNKGFIVAAITTSAVSILLCLRLAFNEPVFYIWHYSGAFYLFLAISIFMMKSDVLIAKQKEYEKKIKSYDKRITDIIKSSPFPIIICRLSDDRLILANDNATKLFGIHNHDIEKYKFRDLFADQENRHALNERLEQEKEVQDFEILVKAPSNETPFWLLTSANIIDYNYDIAIYAAFQDITSRKNREVLLKDQATRDPLTSLFNRRYFEDEVAKKIAKAETENTSFSVLMVDADHFKKVNDTYGHKTGDKVLIELAQTCERALRDDDIVARYGGEEFVIYLSDVNVEKAKSVADRLRETISEIVVYSEDNQPIRFTVSIGISSSEVSHNIDALIKTADEALYRAKENGRNRAEIFTPNDLKKFDLEDAKSKKKENTQRHPIFDKEEIEEISLLDGVAENQIIDDKTDIEEKKK